MDAPLDAEDLSRHGQFVFSLARALLRDAHAAEDVAQETWLHWLRAGRGVADARGWLGRAARHLAANRRRSEDRRARHEELAAAPEPSEDPQQKAAEAELLHRLVDAVYALDEPYCGTILARHFEGLSPRALAARLDVPLATVRSREQRALALLRARLDRTHGGRRAWAATLTRLVSGGEVGAGIGIAVLVAAGLVAAGLVFTYEWPWVSPSKARSTAGVAARIVAASEAGITTAGITTAQAPTRREVHAADEIVAAELEQDEALDGVLAGRTLDALGEPVEGVWVIVETAAGERRAFSDAQGAFRLADVGDVRGITAERPGWLFLHATDPEGEPTSLRLEPVTVTLTRSAPLVLDLRTTTGAPIPEVEVDLVPRGEELQDCIAGRDLRRAPRIEGTTDASGHVEFPNVWTGLHLAIGLHLEPNGLTGARQDAGRLCFDPAQPGGPVVVPAGGLALEARLQHFRVAGSVRKRDGRPARPAYGRLLDLGVALGDEARALAERFLSSSGGDTFEFEGFASFVRGPLEVRVMVKGDTVQEVEIKGATLHTSVQEWATLYLEAGDGWERDGLELTLTRTESGSLTGHVLDPEGNELSAGIRILSPESPT
jgi:RNA polymerase sigma-70 factor (ECF subfamily)